MDSESDWNPHQLWHHSYLRQKMAKIYEHVEPKLVSLTCSYYYCLISVQPAQHSILVCDVIIYPKKFRKLLAALRYSTSYSLTQVPESFRAPHPRLSLSASQFYLTAHSRSQLSSSSLSLSTNHSFFLSLRNPELNPSFTLFISTKHAPKLWSFNQRSSTARTSRIPVRWRFRFLT